MRVNTSLVLAGWEFRLHCHLGLKQTKRKFWTVSSESWMTTCWLAWIRILIYPAAPKGLSFTRHSVPASGSNAKNLANAAANLGIDSYQLAKGGWKITCENIEKLIPDLKELMSSLPAGTPIILFCLDNSSFLAACEEEGLMPISKCVQEDDGYHVKGDLVVAPECALHHTLELLKKLVTELSEYQLFFVTPITRCIILPCCNADDHVTNSGNPDFPSKILSDLTKLKFSLRK